MKSVCSQFIPNKDCMYLLHGHWLMSCSMKSQRHVFLCVCSHPCGDNFTTMLSGFYHQRAKQLQKVMTSDWRKVLGVHSQVARQTPAQAASPGSRLQPRIPPQTQRFSARARPKLEDRSGCRAFGHKWELITLMEHKSIIVRCLFLYH